MSKEASQKYRQSAKYRDALQRRMARPEVRERARQAMARYHATPHGRAQTQDYYQEHKAEYRERERQRSKRPDVKAYNAAKQRLYRERNHLKDRARQVIGYLRRKGRLRIPDLCEWCKRPPLEKLLEAHHWLGYEPEHWLDVKFVHPDPCHEEANKLPPGEWP